MDVPNAGQAAEGAGFEPAVQGYRTPVFKTGAFDHSATPPRGIVAGEARRRRATRPGLAPECAGIAIYFRQTGRTE